MQWLLEWVQFQVIVKLVQQVSPVIVDVLLQLFNGGRLYHTNSVGQLMNDITSGTLQVCVLMTNLSLLVLKNCTKYGSLLGVILR